MKIDIHASIDYRFDKPTDLLLQLEAAVIPEQTVERAHLEVSPSEHFARVPAQDLIGERIWLRMNDAIAVDYTATVSINRILRDLGQLSAVPPHQLPGETVQYLLPSRYCESHRFQSFVQGQFDQWAGGDLVLAIRDWVHGHLRYVPGASDANTTAADTFLERQGVCRDYAHLFIALTRAACIPARMASVYALDVQPQDFHAVAEVFLAGEWHLVDATGMADEAAMAKIGVGRDAADVAFLTAFGFAALNAQSVQVSRVD